MLTQTSSVIKICKEETLADIQQRYIEYNRNAASYTWKILNSTGQFITLRLDYTLEQNGIQNETDEFIKLGMDEDIFLPNLLIYYNDDLNEI